MTQATVRRADADPDRVLSIARRFRAPRARVWAAMTDPKEVAQWFGPRGARCVRSEGELRVGGRYSLECVTGEGNAFALDGEYREIRAPERLVYSWIWRQGGMAGFETVVTLDLVALGPAETELRVRHELFSDTTWRNRHGIGWGGGLDRLDARLWQEADPARVPVVHGVSPSTFTRAVRMALIEKGLAHRLEPARPHTPEQNARHPFERIPTFALGDVRLFESGAICRYVDEALPGPALQPADPLARARMQQWVSAAGHYLMQDIGFSIAFERLAAPRVFGRPPDEARIREALPRAEADLRALDAALASTGYFVGESPTLADLAVFPIAEYAAMLPDTKGLVDSLPHLSAWLAKMRTRPSARETTPDFDSLPKADAPA
jgi:glutathione S-transferase